MRYVRNILLTAFILTFVLSGLSYGETWTLYNSNGGEGYIQVYPNGFTLVGSNFNWDTWYPGMYPVPPFGSTTTYTFTAERPELWTYEWHYESHDQDGACWDPAGYVINGAYHQLSPVGTVDSCEWSSYDTGGPDNGFLTVQLNPGDTFGFYVSSEDNVGGPGLITVTGGNAPEPAPLSLLATGLIGLVALRRRIT